MQVKKTWLRGDRLARLRRDANWSQEEVADKLSVSQQHVSKWEAGNNDPSAEMLVRIAAVFDVSVDYLLGITNEPKAEAPERRRPDLRELLVAVVDEGNAAEALEIIARVLKGGNHS